MANIEIGTFDYHKNSDDGWALPFDYHCLYILEMGKRHMLGRQKMYGGAAKSTEKRVMCVMDMLSPVFMFLPVKLLNKRRQNILRLC